MKLSLAPVPILVSFAPGLRLAGETQTSFKVQRYAEEDGRIQVDSAYALYDTEFGAQWRLSVEGIYNSISGATPNGLLPEPGGPIPTDQIDDHREAVIVDLGKAIGDWSFDLNLNAGQETDYDSRGAAVTVARELNHKNTTLSAGYGYTSDQVSPVFFPEAENKHIHDVVLGLTQILSPRTLLAVNLGWSRQSGYLNDPYKLVQRDFEVIPGFTLPLTYKENRPHARERWILFSQLTHHFDAAAGTLEANYRFTTDDWGIDAHTIGLTWIQELGESFIVQPAVRWLRQSAADFYLVSLNGVNFDPDTVETGAAPYFAADHRLSEMQTLNYGLKLRWQVNDHLALDLNLERYELRGLDGVTPAATYSKANVATLGGSWTF